MIHLKSLIAILLVATLSLTSCKKDEATVTENLTAEWNSTSVKIDGVASPATTTMFCIYKAISNTKSQQISLENLVLCKVTPAI